MKNELSSELESDALTASCAVTEGVGSLSSASSLLLVVTSGVTSSSEEALVHQVLDVYASSHPESPETASEASSETIIELLGLRVIVACHVVDSAPFGIFQQFVGISYFLKLLFGSWVFFVAIGVVLLGPLLEASPDLILVGILGDAEHFVGVGHLHLHLSNKASQDQH